MKKKNENRFTIFHFRRFLAGVALNWLIIDKKFQKAKSSRDQDFSILTVFLKNVSFKKQLIDSKNVCDEIMSQQSESNKRSEKLGLKPIQTIALEHRFIKSIYFYKEEVKINSFKCNDLGFFSHYNLSDSYFLLYSSFPFCLIK